jgi:hypothetical protein
VLVLFFNRPDLLRTVIDRVVQARPRRVYLACDGPRDDVAGDQAAVQECRRIACEAGWDCPVETRFLDRNDGCTHAVSGAITWFFEHEPEGIVLEDDCVPCPDFFRFATEMLARYRDAHQVMSISGASFARPGPRTPATPSYSFCRSSSVWGWATWARAWRHHRLSLTPADVDALRPEDLPASSRASLRGWRKRLRSCIGDRPSTWDYQWSYAQFVQRGLSVVPIANLVTNVSSEGGTHMRRQSAWQDVPAQRLDWPLVHPASIERDTRLDRHLERVCCNHRPWLPRKAWQLVGRHRLAAPQTIRNGLDPATALAALHAVLAMAWLAAMAIGSAPESILFVCLCVVTIVRTPALLRGRLPAGVMLPLALWGALVAWMTVSFLWSDTSLSFGQAMPGRWFLGPLLVLPAALTPVAVLGAGAVAGLWWAGLLAVGALGAALPSWLAPHHVSQSFTGLSMLGIAGMATAATARAWVPRVLGCACLVASIVGAGVAGSRGTAFALILASVMTLVAAGGAGAARLVRRAAIASVAAGALLAIALALEVGEKMSESVVRAESALTEPETDDRPPVIRAADALTTGRGSLHAWTAYRVPDAWLAGHGAGSWGDDFAEASIAHSTALLPRAVMDNYLGTRFFAHQLYLQTAYEYGAVGLGLLAAFAASCWLKAWPRRRTLAGAAIIALIVTVGAEGLADLRASDRRAAFHAVMLLALLPGLNVPPDAAANGKRTRTWTWMAALSIVAIVLAASHAVRTRSPDGLGVTVIAPDPGYKFRGNLLPSSVDFPGKPWAAESAGAGKMPDVRGKEVSFDAGGMPSPADGSYLAMPFQGLEPGARYTFSFGVRGPEGSFIAARGAAGAGFSRIPLNGRWQRVHLTEQAGAGERTELRIGLAAHDGNESPLPSSCTVELRDPQLTLGGRPEAYDPTHGPGASALPLHSIVLDDAGTDTENRLRWSSCLHLPPWIRSGLANVTPGTSGSPVGTKLVSMLVEDTGTGPHAVAQSFECTQPGEWTASILVDPRSRQACRLTLSLPGSEASADFDLKACTVARPPAPELGGATIERLDERWCWLRLHGHAAAAGPGSLRLQTLDAPTGDGLHVGDGKPALRAWGAQVEPGRGARLILQTAFRPRSVTGSGNDPAR